MIDFFKLFRKKKTDVEIESGVYFHEDSFNQVAFLPGESYSAVQTENIQIQNFDDEHFVGFGFSDIYTRNENAVTLADRQIPFENIDAIFAELPFTKTDEVYTGYGSARWKCDNTTAFSHDRATLYVTVADGFVTDFWIDGFRFHDDNGTKQLLKTVLVTIGGAFNLILNDWDLAVTIDLRNPDDIDRYLNRGFDN